MGIIINALSIIIGSLVGSVFKERIKFKNFTVFGIAIMMIGIVGFFENIFNINGMMLESNDLLVIVFALIIGTILGDVIQLESKINNLSSLANGSASCFIDSTIFFAVGGMQICGPIMLATVGDNSQLIFKSLIDFPFALMFGISYGRKVLLSSIPVALGQMIIVLLTILSRTFFDTTLIKQLCAMGYIILFFSGFNLICGSKYKINNVNMLIGIIIILIYNAILKLWRYI